MCGRVHLCKVTVAWCQWYRDGGRRHIDGNLHGPKSCDRVSAMCRQYIASSFVGGVYVPVPVPTSNTFYIQRMMVSSSVPVAAHLGKGSSAHLYIVRYRGKEEPVVEQEGEGVVSAESVSKSCLSSRWYAAGGTALDREGYTYDKSIDSFCRSSLGPLRRVLSNGHPGIWRECV